MQWLGAPYNQKSTSQFSLPLKLPQWIRSRESVCMAGDVQGTQFQSLGWEDPLEKEMATHSSILAWKIPWTEELGRLQPMGQQESDMTQRLSNNNKKNWTTNSLTDNINNTYFVYYMYYCILTIKLRENAIKIIKLFTVLYCIYWYCKFTLSVYKIGLPC